MNSYSDYGLNGSAGIVVMLRNLADLIEAERVYAREWRVDIDYGLKTVHDCYGVLRQEYDGGVSARLMIDIYGLLQHINEMQSQRRIESKPTITVVDEPVPQIEFKADEI